RCSITDDAATLLLGTSVPSSLKGGGLRQAEDPDNPLQPSPILSTKPGQLQRVLRLTLTRKWPQLGCKCPTKGVQTDRVIRYCDQCVCDLSLTKILQR